MNDSPQAPHGLDLVIDFVNTLDLETGEEQLATGSELRTWLAERGLLRPQRKALPSEADHAQALRLREALRSLMLANNGGPGDDAAGKQLERVARRGDLGVHFAEAGSISIAARAAGYPGALAGLLVPVAEALSDGSWQRVKACRSHNCHWAFYDRSRNRSGVWCEMAVCGNRTKVRAYRERTPGGERSTAPG
jgi:predicted RNA-binding Zn ribbon-like protein